MKYGLATGNKSQFPGIDRNEYSIIFKYEVTKHTIPLEKLDPKSVQHALNSIRSILATICLPIKSSESKINLCLIL